MLPSTQSDSSHQDLMDLDPISSPPLSASRSDRRSWICGARISTRVITPPPPWFEELFGKVLEDEAPPSSAGVIAAARSQLPGASSAARSTPPGMLSTPGGSIYTSPAPPPPGIATATPILSNCSDGRREISSPAPPESSCSALSKWWKKELEREAVIREEAVREEEARADEVVNGICQPIVQVRFKCIAKFSREVLIVCEPEIEVYEPGLGPDL